MGRTDLDIRLIVGDDILRPTVLGATEKGDLYVILTLPDLGAHFSNHGGKREQITIRNLEQTWRLNRHPSSEERGRLRERFQYEATCDDVVYFLPLREVVLLGERVMNVDRRTNTIDLPLDAILEKFPHHAVDGVLQDDLESYLDQVEDDCLLGLDFRGGRGIAAWREDDDWEVLGIPLESAPMEEALKGTTLQEGLVEPLWASAEVILEHIAEDEELVTRLNADAETFVTVLEAIAAEIYTRLVREVGVTDPQGGSQS